MVVIVDPHLKRTDSYPVYKQARDIGALVKRPDGKEDFEGWCWSGSAGWVDFFNPASWEFWKKLFNYKPGPEWSWTQSTDDIHIWNDMNEPSIFNGPEITMQKDAVHYGGWEHRDVHNINGMPLVGVLVLALNDLFSSLAGQRDGGGPHRARRQASAPLRAHPFLLRRYAALRSYVDGRQPRHLGAYGRRYQDVSRKQHCRNGIRRLYVLSTSVRDDRNTH